MSPRVTSHFSAKCYATVAPISCGAVLGET